MQRTWAYGRRRIISIIFYTILLVSLIAIDQFTKYYFKGLFEKQGTTIVIKDFFSFTYAKNDGAAWSFLSGVSWAQTFFKILTCVSLIIFGLFFYYALKKGYKWLKFSIIFIIAGTIGNFIDRVLLNFVIDFISFEFWGWRFPVFNFADCCLTVGVIMLIIHYLFFDNDCLIRLKKKQLKIDKEEIEQEIKQTSDNVSQLEGNDG